MSEDRTDWIEDEEPMSLEEAGESLRLAMLSTDDSHPDASEIERAAKTIKAPAHYTPKPQSSTLWMFTTPTGNVRNLISEDRAKKIAKAQRDQDIEEAYSKEGPIATVLRLYFDGLTEGMAETPTRD